MRANADRARSVPVLEASQLIHYHGSPISGPTLTQMAYRGRHAMISFADIRHAPMIAEICQSFAVDNGAFSVWKAGGEYDVKRYADFIRQWHRHPGCDWYLLPDTIEGDQHDNARMRAQWFNAAGSEVWGDGVPVWHLHEPLDVLRDFANAWKRVAFGSSGQYAEIGTPHWWQRMGAAMDVVTDADGVPTVKLHGLRMLDPRLFSVFPFASADSTNVARNVGMDDRWKGTYTPTSPNVRALVLMDRIESHASATRWVGHGWHEQMDLLG